jgi:hypothetical protein
MPSELFKFEIHLEEINAPANASIRSSKKRFSIERIMSEEEEVKETEAPEGAIGLSKNKEDTISEESSSSDGSVNLKEHVREIERLEEQYSRIGMKPPSPTLSRYIEFQALSSSKEKISSHETPGSCDPDQ